MREPGPASLAIERLADRVDLVPTVRRWFEAEWPDYYGPGGRGSAEVDLRAYSNAGSLPIGLVASLGGQPCGFAALKREPFASHPHLGPWVGAAVVVPALRRQGIGRALVEALEAEARSLGHDRLYCATATSASLLERGGWREMARVAHEGETVLVFEKAL